MSHQATNWAIRQRGLKPALKIVLWHLADCHNPAHGGAFPSQDYLASECEVPRSTLNVYLAELETRGLIARERRRREGSQRQERTHYYFPFEPDFQRFSAQQPSPETGHGDDVETESRNEGEPSPENAESRVQNLDSNLVREPVKEPVSEREPRERGPSGSGEDDHKQLLKRVKALELGRNGNSWPGALSSSTQWALTQFEKLTAEERQMAEERRDAYLALVGKKAVALGVYLRDRKFLDVPQPSSESGGKGASGEALGKASGWAASFSRPHAARYWRILLAGPERADAAPENGHWFSQHLKLAWPSLFAFWQHSDLKGGIALTEVDAKLGERMEFVPSDSETMSAWRAAFRDWRFPEPRTMQTGAYFPKGGPDGLEEFERAARSIMAARDEDDAA